jgi:hypothetical protein
MIPRYQKILFFLLLAASLAMAGILWHLRTRAHQRLLAGEDSVPTRAPEVTAAEPATLVVASDADGSLLPQDRALPLPADPGTRARMLLGKLLDVYAAPDAAHPVSGGAAGIAQVFLLPATGDAAKAAQDAQMAVVNLTGSFAAGHPSGIETETLTVLSICATLRANLPQVVAVRFLVDGQERPTLAGHADLTRTYLTENAVPSGGSSQ